MHDKGSHLSTFQREYLWELELARKQILALAEVIPEEVYDWRPAEDARTFASVLVHIAAANFMLLFRADVCTPGVMALCGGIEGEGVQQWLGMVRKSFEMERAPRKKTEVLELLERSFEDVRESMFELTEEALGCTRDLGGEVGTYRRVFLRILAHADEHMGQAIAYARAMGFRVPWPDPLQVLEEMAEKAASP